MLNFADAFPPQLTAFSVSLEQQPLKVSRSYNRSDSNKTGIISPLILVCYVVSIDMSHDRCGGEVRLGAVNRAVGSPRILHRTIKG